MGIVYPYVSISNELLEGVRAARRVPMREPNIVGIGVGICVTVGVLVAQGMGMGRP